MQRAELLAGEEKGMNKERFYISTIANDADEAAKRYGLGLEIAEYCTAYNMDEKYEETSKQVDKKIIGVENRVLHAPYNELFPCAIDPKARELAKSRYRQAIALAKGYGCKKVVIHGGYNPMIYYPIWYVEQSIIFYKELLAAEESVEISLENVLEEEPEMLRDIILGVKNDRLGVCLDVGHVNVYSKVSPQAWVGELAENITHFHLHNNDSSMDAHRALYDGNIDMKKVLIAASELCPKATFSLEVLEAKPSIEWLIENEII